MRRGLMSGVLMGLFVTGVLLGQTQRIVPSSESRAAQLLGLPVEALKDAESHTIRLHALGRDITVVKGLDRASGEVVGGAFDASGAVVDLSALRTLEVLARKADPSKKLDPVLVQALQAADPTESIRIGLWLEYPQAEYDANFRAEMAAIDSESHEAMEAAEARAAEYVFTRNAQITAPVVEFLNGIGLAPRYVSTTAPAIMLTARPGQIAGLAELPQVDTIYLETLDREEHNNDANATHRTSRVHRFGVKGRGTRIAVLENNGIEPACPWLNVTAWFNAGTPNPDDHVHGTSGCIASNLSSRMGAAPEVDLFSANAASYSDTDVFAAGDWIATQNIDATNMSFGGNTNGAADMSVRYFEYQARQFADNYVASAGNDGNGNGEVGAPGLAWNCLTVGSFGNQDTASWLDDSMSGFSSFDDPSSGCEKPNIVAVGETIDTLGDGTVSPQGTGCPGLTQPAAWLIDNYCGTSFSAPHATGNLANAMVVDSTLTINEPAVAMMMATAWNNIEGSSRLSDLDGAGGIQAAALHRASVKGQATWVTLTTSSFNTNGYYTYNITLKAFDRARVCIAWSAQADNTYATSMLDADLDLAVFQGSNVTSGSSLGFSSSFNNNFEILEFTPTVSGTYTVRINDFRFDGTSERCGIAWSQKQSDGASARIREFDSETDADSGPTIGNSSYWLDIRAPGSPNAAYITYPGGSMATGLPFSDFSWGPVDYDVWTDIWFNGLTGGPTFWTNSSGTLSSTGSELSQRMFLPDFPPLVGLPLHHVAAMIDPMAPNDMVTEISEVHTFEFWPDPVDQARSDDGSFIQPLPFGFEFYNVVYTQCHVNMNGNITFGTADSDFTESAAEMLSDQPRIAALWNDLGPHQLDGSSSTPIVRVREIFTNNQKVVIEFINVPLRTSGTSTVAGTGDNTFRVTLSNDNSIKIEYRDCDIDEALVGISPGNGISTATEVDLSSNGERFFGTNAAIFEDFTGTGGDDLDILGNPSYYYGVLEFIPNSTVTRYTLKVDTDG